MASVVELADDAAVADAAADRLTELIGRSITDRGTAFVALTGGRTPRRLYEQLADPNRPWRGRIDWSLLHLCWGDERHVPPHHPDSNVGMAERALVRHVPIPASHVHRVRAEMPDAAAAAADYDRVLRRAFDTSGGAGDPTLDVVLLGIGEDAHIASIFPNSPLLDTGMGATNPGAAPGPERRGGPSGPPDIGPLAVAVWVPHLDAWRITLTPATVLAGRHVLVLACGEAKADAVHAALEAAPVDVRHWPAQLLRASGARATWFIDRAAARRRVAPPA